MQEPLAEKPDCGTGGCAFHVDLPLRHSDTTSESHNSHGAVSRTTAHRPEPITIPA